MSMTRCLVTGATGFVGGHAAEALRQNGYSVAALARIDSDISRLESLGIDLVRGDLSDPDAVRRAVRGADVVVHCAAKVGDWGPVEEYRAANVDGLRHLLEAARRQPLKRFVHLSSLGVYQARHHHGTDESAPLPERHMDGYTQTKVEAEKLALSYHREFGLPLVILRPGFIYGPRDRTVLPRLIDALAKKQVRYLGSGRQAMNTIYVGNLVDAILLALEKDCAVGQVYNLTDDEEVSKRRFLEAIADLAGLERPRGWVPLWFARLAAAGMEGMARLVGARQPPRLTRARVKFLGLNLAFSVEKAKRELGYRPRVSFDAGIEEAVAWWRSAQAPAAPRPQPAAAHVISTEA